MNFHDDYDYEAAHDRWLDWKLAEKRHAAATGEWLHLGENDPPEDDEPTDEEADA
jgi:hypothetical protein